MSCYKDIPNQFCQGDYSQVSSSRAKPFAGPSQIFSLEETLPCCVFQQDMGCILKKKCPQTIFQGRGNSVKHFKPLVLAWNGDFLPQCYFASKLCWCQNLKRGPNKGVLKVYHFCHFCPMLGQATQASFEAVRTKILPQDITYWLDGYEWFPKKAKG